MITRENFIAIIWGLFYYSLLTLVYTEIITVYWGYFNFENDSKSTRKLLADILYFLSLLLLVVHGGVDRVKRFYLLLLFLFTIAPLIVYFKFNSKANIGGLWVYLYQYVLIILGLKIRMFNSFVVFQRSFSFRSLLLFLILLTLIPFVILFLKGGMSNWNLNPELVYDFRESESSKFVLTGYMAYLTMWSLVIFANFLLLYFYVSQKYFIVFGIVVFYFLWYGMTGHKSFLMYPIFSIVIFHVLRSKSPSIILLRFLSVLILFFYLIDVWVLTTPFLTSTFTRRLLFIPANTAFAYYDYFSNSGFLYWSNSFMKVFLNYNYEVSPALLVGSYMGDSTMVANNSFMSTGYMHLGFLGATFYSLLFVIIVRMASELSRSSNGVLLVWKIAVLNLPLFQLLTSSDLFTALLTHGLGVGLLLLSITKKNSFESSRHI